MAYIPPPRRSPRRSEPRLTRTIRHGDLIYLKGARPPENVSRRQAEQMKRSGMVK